MWKYVSRRLRDTFERSINHFEKRGTTGIVNTNGGNEEKNSSPPCKHFSQKCWNSFREDNTNSKRCWDFEQFNQTWIGAISWSSAIVIGWYTSKIVHLRLKYHSKEDSNSSSKQPVKKCPSICNLRPLLYPYISYVNKNAINSVSKIDKIIGSLTPTVHSVSNEPTGLSGSQSSVTTDDTSKTKSCDSDLGEVLNSIENRLGLASIESGHHADGLNLLRSAAKRNHAPAQYNLGLCYELGLGVAVDEKVAMELYRSAAALEHPGALYNLGIYYGQGRGGLPTDSVMATRLLRLAAVQGQKDAINALKVLEGDSQGSDQRDVNNWSPNHYKSNIESDFPIHQTHLVENVNFLHTATC